MRSTARTSGDGMEMVQNKNNESLKSSAPDEKHDSINKIIYKAETLDDYDLKSHTLIPGLHTIYRPPSLATRSLPPVIPKGKLYLLTPKLIKPNSLPEHKKIRPPKFVPFEPYPCALTFMIQPKQQKFRIKKRSNNLDINIMVSQMSEMKTNELEIKENSNAIKKNENSSFIEIKKFKEERDYFQSQLKFQTQVNSELKNLLVAAVGEDLQTKVNVLTEDKLQLAKALLDSANNLSTHTEQIEFLAGQCEVWRSKFLASSVMVEELAKWKAELTQKNSILVDTNYQMLELTAKARDMQKEMLRNLKFLGNLKTMNLRSADLISLISECLNITQQMVLHSGFGIPNELELNNLNCLTEIEKKSMKSLEMVNKTLMETDEAFRAIVGQAKRKPETLFFDIVK